jgi:hypothetical protein
LEKCVFMWGFKMAFRYVHTCTSYINYWQ